MTDTSNAAEAATPEGTDRTPESLLPDLKAELGAECCEGVSDEHLLMFLNWKPSVKRASERYRNFCQWRVSDGNKGIFDETLMISKDPELERLLASEVIVSPPNLLTKAGGPVLIGRFRNNDMTDGRTVDGVCRMMLYTMDRVLHRPEAQSHGITAIHDVRGFNPSKNGRLEVAKRLVKIFLGVFPVQIKGLYICHAPLVFYGFFKLVSLFMPKKLKGRIHFCDSFSELDTVHGVIDPKNLLAETGGFLEWSVQDWIDEKKLEEESGEWKTLATVK